MNWVGTLDYTLPRKQSNDCPNPHYAFVVAEMMQGWLVKTRGLKEKISA